MLVNTVDQPILSAAFVAGIKNRFEGFESRAFSPSQSGLGLVEACLG
jgi:hypothetical protein